MANNNAVVKQNVNRLKNMLEAPSIKKQLDNALQDNRDLFIASLIDLYSGDNYLAQCSPGAVIQEAFKAATLKLPINKQLGFAYIVPYKNSPTFQIGYKGYIQLGMRSGKFKYLNADVVYEGELQGANKLTGEIDLNGQKTSDKVVGYFAYMQLVNGFEKTLYMAKEEVEAHGKRYSPSYSHKSSAWQSNFDEMAMKTVTRRLLSKYAPMTIDMATAISHDTTDSYDPQDEIDENANQEYLDIDVESVDIEEPGKKESGPDF